MTMLSSSRCLRSSTTVKRVLIRTADWNRYSSSSRSSRWFTFWKTAAAASDHHLPWPSLLPWDARYVPGASNLSWLRWLAQSPKPKEWKDFFPDNLQRPTGSDADQGSSTKPISPHNDEDSSSPTDASSSSNENKADPSRVETSSENSNNKQQNNNNNNNRQKQEPPRSDTDNLPGLLALLALVVLARTLLESSDDQDVVGGGQQEITFVDFRNKYLASTEKLVIVNKKLAQVVLKPDALVDDPPTAGVGTSEASWSSTASTSSSSSSDGDTWETSTPTNASSIPTTHQRAQRYYFYIGSVESLEEQLTKAQSRIHPEEWVEVQYVSRTNYALEAFKVLPMVAFVAAVYFGSRGWTSRGGAGGSGSNNIFSIGRSTAKKIHKQDIQVTFRDVAGCEQAKMEVMEFVDFLKDASRFTKLGAKIPKGALLTGPPGTGKTLLAKAVAGEAGVPFYSISGSDFIEMFVGVGPSRVRDLFKEARANAPCIVFIDEIDAVGRQRGRGGFSGGGNDERENTLNQLLVEMDGFSPTTGVVVLAGTNRIDILDQALTRPGRFDRQITVDRPDLKGRKEIFEVHLRNITLEGSAEEYAGRLAGLTPGFAGADIANLCNEAAIVAARRKADAVTLEDFEKATDRIIGGLESNRIMSAEERSIVAHHEAGHAIAGWFLKHADPLLKVTIIPRTSGALGFAQYLPKEVFLRSQEQIMDLVCVALAGRASEEVFFGRVTTGASDDLRRVTQLVYSTIKTFGMNSRLGQLAFPNSDPGSPSERPYSDSTAEAMDEEARSSVDVAYERAVNLIREHKHDVERLANLLLEKETITHDDIIDLVGPRPFAGDSVYEEFVSHRAAAKKAAETKNETTDTTTSNPEDGNNGELTPGLA